MNQNLLIREKDVSTRQAEQFKYWGWLRFKSNGGFSNYSGEQ